MSHPSFNIVLFGETGVGKSSVVNLIAGKKVAETSPDVQGCTMSFQPYDFLIDGKKIFVWDTVGLEEPEIRVNRHFPAIEQACALIHHMFSQGGVDLLLFCIRGSRVTATTQSNYRLFYEALCRSAVPIAAVITHLEREPNMEEWWGKNEESLLKYGLRFAGHACVTGLPTHSQYQKAQHNIQMLLRNFNNQNPFTMPAEAWFIGFMRYFGLFQPLKKGAKRKDVIKVLTKRCKLDPSVAKAVIPYLEGDRSISQLFETNPSWRETIVNLTDRVVRTTRRPPSRDTLQYTWEERGVHRTVAIKFVIGLNTRKKYHVDFKLRASLKDKTIVPFFGLVDKPMPGIVTEWYANGSLSDYLSHHSSLSLDDKKVMLGDVAVGLRYLHNQNVVHGNLHSNNILVNRDGTCCLTDLSFTLPNKFTGVAWLGNPDHGSVRFADPKLVMRACSAPDEIISPDKYCDIYSFGGVVLHVLFRTRPYGDLEGLEILVKLFEGERPKIPCRPDDVPRAYESLIKDCWDDDCRRPSAMLLIAENWFPSR